MSESSDAPMAGDRLGGAVMALESAGEDSNRDHGV
jgi:hypothetical protein